MMLSDRTLRKLMDNGQLVVLSATGEFPFEDVQIQPVSIDLRLGAVSSPYGGQLSGSSFRLDGTVIMPGQFLLGSTIETVTLCPNLVGKVEGKSTRARQGLIVEAAGLVDPGFGGQLTLEIYNMSQLPIRLKYGMKICQLCLDWVDTTPDRVYGHPDLMNHYQGQMGPTPARTDCDA